ncbi:MAG: hypothetical protein ACYCOU_19750 [Sulfobacillus sp.]
MPQQELQLDLLTPSWEVTLLAAAAVWSTAHRNTRDVSQRRQDKLQSRSRRGVQSPSRHLVPLDTEGSLHPRILQHADGSSAYFLPAL